MKTIAQLINWDFKSNGKLVIKDKKGNRTYFELADGFWARYEYDSEGNQIYFENSDGQIVDYRHKPSEDSVVEIDDVKHKLTKL